MNVAERYGQLFIGGEWSDSTGDDQIAVINPSNEEVIAAVPSASAKDAELAVAAARHAFDAGPWPRMTLDERVEILRRFHALYVAQREDLARLITTEMGCPIGMSAAIQTVPAGLILESIIELSDIYPWNAVRRAGTGNALVTREPVGVVAAVTPWNVPQNVAMLKLAPALLSGCTVVLKPAPETPLDAYVLADLASQAGLPPGVLNILPAGREVSELLISDSSVDKVAFTGSTGAGRRIASICGAALRRVTLELGGKSAAIFLDDADFDSSVEKLRMGSLRNSGQVCSLKTRILVSERRESELLERLVALMQSMPVGDPMDPETQIGPMVTARHRSTVQDYIDVGHAEGARAVYGGGPASDFDRGWYVSPTIFAGVQPDSRIAQEEIFGPVLSVITYRGEDDAVAIANNSPYGLNGAVFTQDPMRGLAVAKQIRTGTVELDGSPAGLLAPMGGFKDSGIGREQGHEGIDSYTEPRAIGIPADLADRLQAR